MIPIIKLTCQVWNIWGNRR